MPTKEEELYELGNFCEDVIEFKKKHIIDSKAQSMRFMQDKKAAICYFRWLDSAEITRELQRDRIFSFASFVTGERVVWFDIIYDICQKQLKDSAHLQRLSESRARWNTFCRIPLEALIYKGKPLTPIDLANAFSYGCYYAADYPDYAETYSYIQAAPSRASRARALLNEFVARTFPELVELERIITEAKARKLLA